MILTCNCCGVQIESDSNLLFKRWMSGLRHLHIEEGTIACSGGELLMMDPKQRHVPVCHPSETCVVWRHPGTGEIRYPGRNDVLMPVRYQRAGYERHEMRTLRTIESFEKRNKVVNEAVWFDRGSGREF